MKTQLLFSIVFAFLIMGCKKEVPQTTAPIVEETKAEEPKTACYSYEANGNSISLQMEITGTNVKGDMVYALAEKDRNTGHFTGTIENNLLIADYTFQSEGAESTRQLAFQIKDDKLIEGFGGMNDEGTKFKDVTQLKFNSAMPLNKIDCPK